MRKWKTLETKIHKLIAQLETLRVDVVAFSDWSGSAEELATDQHNVYPPHTTQTFAELPLLPSEESPTKVPVRDMDQAFSTNLTALRWMLEVTRRAKIWAGQDKKRTAAKTTTSELTTLYEV